MIFTDTRENSLAPFPSDGNLFLVGSAVAAGTGAKLMHGLRESLWSHWSLRMAAFRSLKAARLAPTGRERLAVRSGLVQLS